ncbi:molybdopterin-dependent oxidoreductase, partial [Shigella flexneri]|nr:molybdopterin-dependent oxidoreductase [Shigella flexneri]
VAHELSIPLARVRASATDTSKVANTSATAASTGADLDGKAAQGAAATLNRRLREFAAKMYACEPAAVVFANGMVYAGDAS